jgi:hypothetical protein
MPSLWSADPLSHPGLVPLHDVSPPAEDETSRCVSDLLLLQPPITPSVRVEACRAREWLNPIAQLSHPPATPNCPRCLLLFSLLHFTSFVFSSFVFSSLLLFISFVLSSFDFLSFSFPSTFFLSFSLCFYISTHGHNAHPGITPATQTTELLLVIVRTRTLGCTASNHTPTSPLLPVELIINNSIASNQKNLAINNYFRNANYS